MNRFSIRCELCNYRHLLERPVVTPGLLFIVCHGCERALVAEVTETDLDDPELRRRVAASWATLLR